MPANSMRQGVDGRIVELDDGHCAGSAGGRFRVRHGAWARSCWTKDGAAVRNNFRNRPVIIACRASFSKTYFASPGVSGSRGGATRIAMRRYILQDFIATSHHWKAPVPSLQVLLKKEDLLPVHLEDRVVIVLDILFATSTMVHAFS